MSDSLLAYSDAVVARYMERVLELSPTSRMTIDQPVWPDRRRGLSFNLPTLLYLDPMAALWSASAIRAASVAATPEGRHAFAAFWEQLKLRNWTLTGRRHVSFGLLAVRSRRIDAEWAIRRYRPMNDLIPPQSIGWD